MVAFANVNQGLAIEGITTSAVRVEVTIETYPDMTGTFGYLIDGRWPTGANYALHNGGTELAFAGVDVFLNGAYSTSLTSSVTAGDVIRLEVAAGHGGNFMLFNKNTLDENVPLGASQVVIKSADGATTLHTYDLSNPTSATVADQTGTADATLQNFTFGPALAVTPGDLPLTPGGTISGTYSNYATIPTTLTVSDGTNTITIASPTITDNGDGTGSFSGTMPALPTTGTANLVLFGDVTVELT